MCGFLCVCMFSLRIFLPFFCHPIALWVLSEKEGVLNLLVACIFMSLTISSDYQKNCFIYKICSNAVLIPQNQNNPKEVKTAFLKLSLHFIESIKQINVNCCLINRQFWLYGGSTDPINW